MRARFLGWNLTLARNSRGVARSRTSESPRLASCERAGASAPRCQWTMAGGCLSLEGRRVEKAAPLLNSDHEVARAARLCSGSRRRGERPKIYSHVRRTSSGFVLLGGGAAVRHARRCLLSLRPLGVGEGRAQDLHARRSPASRPRVPDEGESRSGCQGLRRLREPQRLQGLSARVQELTRERPELRSA